MHYTGLAQVEQAAYHLCGYPAMFLPTITYGFAIIYSFGKQGLITRLLGRQLFDIYGFFGLMVGYVIYTIPVAFCSSTIPWDSWTKRLSPSPR